MNSNAKLWLPARIEHYILPVSDLEQEVGKREGSLDKLYQATEKSLFVTPGSHSLCSRAFSHQKLQSP